VWKDVLTNARPTLSPLPIAPRTSTAIMTPLPSRLAASSCAPLPRSSRSSNARVLPGLPVGT
jgi:hypothetical protein